MLTRLLARGILSGLGVQVRSRLAFVRATRTGERITVWFRDDCLVIGRFGLSWLGVAVSRVSNGWRGAENIPSRNWYASVRLHGVVRIGHGLKFGLRIEWLM